MKNIKISDDLHRQIKQISGERGLTMDGVLRKLLEVGKADNQKADSAGGNAVQEDNTTGSYSQVEKGAEDQKGENQKDGYVSRKEFDEVLESLQKWTKNLVEESMEFCPNCGHVLYLHAQDHSSHDLVHYEYVEDDVYGRGGFYHLECPRCGYYVNLEKPKYWQYKDPDKKTLDLRNAEGRGEQQ